MREAYVHKDEKTGAVLSTDDGGLQRYKESKNKFIQLKNRINTLEDRLSRIEEKLNK